MLEKVWPFWGIKLCKGGDVVERDFQAGIQVWKFVICHLMGINGIFPAKKQTKKEILGYQVI